MDTRTLQSPHTGQQVDVQQLISEIKQHMPQTYQAIQDKAATEGKAVFALVRRGLRGEPNCFYAIEAGRVMGAPFNLVGVSNEIAGLICQFGFRHLVMWAQAALATPMAMHQDGPPIGTPSPQTPQGNSPPALPPVAGVGKSEQSSEREAAR